MSFSDLNYLTIVIAGILNMGLGYVWYGPLFAKPWMKMVGLTEEKILAQTKSMGMTYLTSFVLALIGATVFQLIFMSFNPVDLMEAIMLAVIVWFGLIFSVVMNHSLFEKRPFKLVLINSGYYLASLIIWSLLFLYVG